LRENSGNLRMLFFGGEIVQIWVNCADQSVERRLRPILRMQLRRRVVLSGYAPQQRESECLAEP
jgi:hypothetical protein